MTDSVDTDELRALVERWREQADEYHDTGHFEAYNMSQKRADDLEELIENE